MLQLTTFVEIHLVSSTAQVAMTKQGVTLQLAGTHRMVVETVHLELGSQASDLLIEIHMGKSCDWYHLLEDILRESSEVMDGQIVPSEKVTVVGKIVETGEV